MESFFLVYIANSVSEYKLFLAARDTSVVGHMGGTVCCNNYKTNYSFTNHNVINSSIINQRP